MVLGYRRVEAIPLKVRRIVEGENVIEVLVEAIKRKRLKLYDGDVIAIADKVLAFYEKRIVNYQNVHASEKALLLAKKYNLEPGFVQLVLNESEKVFGGVERAILTLTRGILMANAGVDHKNAPPGKAALWPKNPELLATKIRVELEKRFGKKLAVIIVDSKVNPLRRGTVGIAIGFSGLVPVLDCRGEKDLFGNSLKITFMNVVDDLAAMAHLLMGETTESIPFVLIRNAPINLTEEDMSDKVRISEEDCLILNSLREYYSSKD
ncbi:MAG: coenzyme F420-0:L-glutamate ligase [Nitrososphaeria archaeon]